MTTQLKINTTLLDPTLTLRPAQWADAEAVAGLILDVCTHDGDPTVAVTVEELQREWKTPGFELERNAFVVETSDGRIVGYEEFVDYQAHAVLGGDGYVHPEFMGRGIGTAMLRALDARARQEMELADAGLRVIIRNGMSSGDTVSREMHEAEGYRPVRFSWRMEITLDSAPPVPKFPEGIEMRPFGMEQDRAVYEAHQEAFSDHWGHVRRPYEKWVHRFSDRDASLWFIAWDGRSAEIAGYSLCRFRMGIGWVGALGVRRAWRKRGLGEALLLHSFNEFYKRDMQVIGLGVDAANPTGATRLYQKAGMKVAAEYVIYEKELRPGRDLEEHEGE
jgi:mycothiol synthase